MQEGRRARQEREGTSLVLLPSFNKSPMRKEERGRTDVLRGETGGIREKIRKETDLLRGMFLGTQGGVYRCVQLIFKKQMEKKGKIKANCLVQKNGSYDQYGNGKQNWAPRMKRGEKNFEKKKNFGCSGR